jgi:hypothetical protein
LIEHKPTGTEEPETGRFASGELVWVNGRQAFFCYPGGAGAAVVRYRDESVTRVVPVRKLTSAPPSPAQ